MNPHAFAPPPVLPIRILVVEDEPAIAESVLYALRTEGFAPTHVTLGHLALEELRRESYRVAILDVGLPDCNGFDLFRNIRQLSEIPVIFLTARSDEVDRVLGLEIGADDYVTKPFSPRELAARVRVILRRSGGSMPQAPPSDEQKGPGFRVDADKQRIYCEGHALELTRYEYRLLKTFLENPERIFSRDDLMRRIWTAPDHSLDRTVDSHIKTLRAKVRSVTTGPDPIQTHRGQGYSWKPGS